MINKPVSNTKASNLALRLLDLPVTELLSSESSDSLSVPVVPALRLDRSECDPEVFDFLVLGSEDVSRGSLIGRWQFKI